jgi:aspartyl protease family protein
MPGLSRRRVLLAAAALACGHGWSRAAWVSRDEHEVPLEGDGTFWHVRATLNSRARATFLVDTGATLCVLSPAMARRLDLVGIHEVELRTANGTVRAPLVRLRQIEVGEARARDLEAVVHEAVSAPLDGVLGLNFLNRFHYAIDPQRRVLRLQ